MRYLLLFIGFPFFQILGQELQPAEHAILNFTQVLFETEEITNAERYLFIIHDKNRPEAEQKQWDSTYVTILNELHFGTNYEWYVEAYAKNGQLLNQGKHHFFSIAYSPITDKKNYRYRILRDDTDKTNDGILFLDYSNVAINRQGEVVWFLPETKNKTRVRTERLRDLKMTGSGTLTYLTINQGLEISLDNKIRWSTPGNGDVSGDTTEYYHHEFTKLPGKNYLILGKSYETKTLTLGDRTIHKFPITVVIQYNSNGDTTWTWSSRKYIQDDDLLKVGKKVFYGNTFGHANSVAQSADGKRIYVGFRDLNSILVIDKTTRKLLHSYGDKIPSDTTKNAIGFFKKQHAAIPINENQILVFNNNDRGGISSVVVFTECGMYGEPAVKTWEFPCTFDSVMPGASDRMGNAELMKNGDYLVNMGQIARLFEVTPEKQIVWDCLPEKWNSDSSRWEAFPNYRLNFQRSLYPKYFSVSLKNDELNAPYMIVQNEGSDADSYIVLLTCSGKKKTHRIQLSIEPEAGKIIYLNRYFSKRALKKEISIQVLSDSNEFQKYQRSFILNQ